MNINGSIPSISPTGCSDDDAVCVSCAAIRIAASPVTSSVLAIARRGGAGVANATLYDAGAPWGDVVQSPTDRTASERPSADTAGVWAAQGWQPRLPFIEALYDFPLSGRPTRFCLVVGAPRSGGNYLCRELWATGLMGAPMQYFNFYYTMFEMAHRLAIHTLDEYIRKLFALRTSPNGVFSVKAHWKDFEFMRLAGLKRYMPVAHFIRTTRRDRLAQAVSHARALQTGQWQASLHARQDPAYDFGRIQSCLAGLAREEDSWDAYFGKTGVRPIEVAYEDFVADPPAVVNDILARLRFRPDPASRVELPDSKRQSDSINKEWIARYRSDAQTLARNE
jgi:LPS sulfotransferase NodH